MDSEPIIDATGPDAGPEPPDVERLLAGIEARDEAIAREAAARGALASRLREALAASEPGIDLALITGDSVEAIEASFAAARETVGRVREALRRETAPAIPAGAPPRSLTAPLTPLDKIRAGLGRIA
jgi:hypothetical protein